ncbi:MAG: hypothetical protein GF355_14135, partial [Candidatus Eisenbacteria bacterium]|nr:hypothetical protein [Candidatus Eisenbacteria bacterium]
MLEEALEAAGLDDVEILSRAAAGARLQTADRGALARFYAVWPLVVETHAPGVLIQQAVVDVEEAGSLQEAQKTLGGRLRASRVDQPVRLPAVGPLVERYRRTDEPAEVRIRDATGDERLDRATARKVKAYEGLRPRRQIGDLDRRYLGEKREGRYRFASGIDPVAEGLVTESDPYVGFIHADGNAVGDFITRMLNAADDSAAAFREFSSALQDATEEAVQDAVEDVLIADHAARNPEASSAGRQGESTDAGDQIVLPARPIVLAGDDVTVIVAARLALDFTKRFLEAFERTTRERLGVLQVPDFKGLTAGAGVVLAKYSFPFDRAHELAESLCRQAKKWVKIGGGEIPSALAFHRVTTSLPMSAETVLQHELTSHTRGTDETEAPVQPEGTETPKTIARRLTYEAYGVGARHKEGLARLEDLQALAEALPPDQRGGIRSLLAVLHQSPERATEAFERMCEVRSSRAGGKEETRRLREALRTLTGAGDNGELLWR